jgi:hypothetical protein
MENNNKKSSAFYSYCLNPQVKFDTSEEGEKVSLLVRSHPFTQINWVLTAVLLFILIWIINPFIKNFFDLKQIFILNLFFYVFVASYIWINVLNWYFNAGIVTNRRVIDIDFYSVIYKEITVAQLGKIEDITVKSGGFFGSYFDYGSVYIQTAGSAVNVEFINVPHPSEIAQIINRLLGKKHGYQ